MRTKSHTLLSLLRETIAMASHFVRAAHVRRTFTLPTPEAFFPNKARYQKLPYALGDWY